MSQTEDFFFQSLRFFDESSLLLVTLVLYLGGPMGFYPLPLKPPLSK